MIVLHAAGRARRGCACGAKTGACRRLRRGAVAGRRSGLARARIRSRRGARILFRRSAGRARSSIPRRWSQGSCTCCCPPTSTVRMPRRTCCAATTTAPPRDDRIGCIRGSFPPPRSAPSTPSSSCSVSPVVMNLAWRSAIRRGSWPRFRSSRSSCSRAGASFRCSRVARVGGWRDGSRSRPIPATPSVCSCWRNRCRRCYARKSACPSTPGRPRRSSTARSARSSMRARGAS